MLKTQALKGKVAVISGASSGIGAACALELAEQGASIVVGYHNGQDRAEELCATLPGSGHRAARIALSDSEGHIELAETLARQVGRVDILVNSAGYTRRIAHNNLEEMLPSVFNELLLANVGGTFSLTRALLPLLVKADSGIVINVSSVSAFTGAGSNIAYCAAKAAIDTLTKSLARAFGPQVRFLCVSPAAVDTDFVEGRTLQELEGKAFQTPLGRVVTPEDVAQSVVACVTHLKTATGTSIVIDGGHSL
jgi:3-oxoacyl-[acyl-carrier protein] reductase